MKKYIFACMLVFALLTLSACGSKEEVRSSTDQVATDTAVVLEDGTYNVNVSGSILAWKAAKITGASHTGTVAIKSGSLTIKNGDLEGGTLLIDMTQIAIDEDIPSLLKHLNSADFFDTANFPEASLNITQANKTSEAGLYDVKADLNIKGVTAPVSFQVSFNSADNTLSALSHLNIDRTIWGIKFGSGKFFDNLGDNMIKDDIIFDISVEAVK